MARTPKQQFLDMAKGIQPDRLLQYCYGPNPYASYPLTNMGIFPSVIMFKTDETGMHDIWGVPYVTNRETGFSPMPAPNQFILKDISDWRNVIKAPDLSKVDWKAAAEADLKNLEKMGVDRNQTSVSLATCTGFFQMIMSFMGFEEGLCALVEDPDEVKALVKYLCDFYCEVLENYIVYVKPDLIQLADDIATWRAPFISLEQYRDLFRPAYDRLIAIGKKHGCLVANHCCGNCTVFIDEWIDMGITYWDPAQLSNDLVAIEKKYNDKIVIVGGFDLDGVLVSKDTDEAKFKSIVRDTIDRYTKHGFYVFDGWLYCDPDDPELVVRNKWITEEVEAYGLDAYNRK